MQDYIDYRVALPIAAVLWAVVLFILFRERILPRIDNYFAYRRHLRREKRRLEKAQEAAMVAYLERDIAAVRNIFKPNAPRHIA